MRGFLIWCMLALAIVARAEEEQINQEDDARIDVARMLTELFNFSDEADQEDDLALGIHRDARAKNEEEVESKAVVDPEDQARYNKFMDTFYRRLNADARSTIDPLDVPLTTRKGRKTEKNAAKKKAGNKNVSKKERKDKNKREKNGKKGKKNTKKTGRHPKNLSYEEVENETADEEVDDAVEDHNIVKREAEEVEEIEEDKNEMSLERQERSTDLDEEDEDNVDHESADARRIKKTNADKTKGKKGKNKKRKKSKNKNKKTSKAKRSADKKKNKKGKSRKGKNSSDSGPLTSKASVSGIATLQREGDVHVVNRKDGKELRSDFRAGPITLRINRKFGSGKDAVMRSATANAPELTGKMNLFVAANGKAKITKFTINSPSVVTTDGSLSKDQNKRAGNNNFMEMSIARSTPFAAKKLKLAARAVLLATESKN